MPRRACAVTTSGLLKGKSELDRASLPMRASKLRIFGIVTSPKMPQGASRSWWGAFMQFVLPGAYEYTKTRTKTSRGVEGHDRGASRRQRPSTTDRESTCSSPTRLRRFALDAGQAEPIGVISATSQERREDLKSTAASCRRPLRRTSRVRSPVNAEMRSMDSRVLSMSPPSQRLALR